MLHFDWEGDGTWAANSSAHDDGSPFEWRINVRNDGSFDLSESDEELLPDDGKKSFWTLADAKGACNLYEAMMIDSMKSQA